MDAIRHVNGHAVEGAPRASHLIACAPFAQPTTGEIAVEMVHHCGDEVWEAHEVGGEQTR